MQTNLPTPSVETTIGRHRARIVAEDVVLVAWQGDIEANDAAAVNDLVRSRARGSQSVFLIQDVRNLGAIPVETRRLLARDDAMDLFRHITVIGGGFKVQVLYNMIFKALRALNHLKCSMDFVSSEAEAMRNIEAVRSRANPH